MRPAFVITFATLAASCSRHPPTPEPDSRPVVGNPPEPTATAAPEPTATVATEPARASKKRTVRSPVPQTEYTKGRIDFANSKRLNPSDAQGRIVLARADGHCYVRIPPPPGTPIGPPGMDQSKPLVVDCPDSMQDPAWDTCLHEELTLLASGECICPHTGNPPPPPSLAECPKSKP